MSNGTSPEITLGPTTQTTGPEAQPVVTWTPGFDVSQHVAGLPIYGWLLVGIVVFLVLKSAR